MDWKKILLCLAVLFIIENSLVVRAACKGFIVNGEFTEVCDFSENAIKRKGSGFSQGVIQGREEAMQRELYELEMKRRQLELQYLRRQLEELSNQ